MFREAMFTLDQNISSSSISLATKLRLYNASILPIFLYGSEVWSVTSSLSKKIDALDNWCLRRIFHIHWTDFVRNEEVRSRTGQPVLSDTIHGRRLSFFGHLSRADPSQDHSRALQSCILGPLIDWRHRVGRPRQSWLRTVEDDLRPLNFSLATAGGANRIDWHGAYSWRWLRLLDMFLREKEVMVRLEYECSHCYDVT